MTAKDLITDKIPFVKTSHTGLEVLTLMDDFKVSHLPIANNEQFLGLISEEDIFSQNRFDDSIGSLQLSLSRAYVNEDQHIYEVIKTISEQKLSLVPVVDNRNVCLGVITLDTLVQRFAELMAASNPGGVLILELNENDYSLSEISQIVESNDARILSVYLRTFSESTKLEVTLKINKLDLSSIIATFNRYDYVIRASFSESGYDDYLRDRFDSFMTYLNI